MRTHSNNVLETGDAIILRTMQNLKLKPLFDRHRLFFSWEKIVGADMARYIVPQRFQFNILYVHAYSSAWANNFQYLKSDIISNINKYMENQLVKDIKFTRLNNKNTSSFNTGFEKNINLAVFLKKITLSEEETATSRLITDRIDDTDLRNKIKNVYIKGVKLQKLKKQYGWIKCKGCGRLTSEKDGVCINCKRDIKKERLHKIADIFQAIPWARYQDIVKYVQCDMDMVNKLRQRLVQYKLSQLVPDVDYPDKDRNVKYSDAARRAVMLYKSISPDRITDVVVAETIYKLRFDTSYRMYKKKR